MSLPPREINLLATGLAGEEQGDKFFLWTSWWLLENGSGGEMGTVGEDGADLEYQALRGAPTLLPAPAGRAGTDPSSLQGGEGAALCAGGLLLCPKWGRETRCCHRIGIGVIALDGRVGGKDVENARNSEVPAAREPSVALPSAAGCRSCLLTQSSCSGCGCFWGPSCGCGSCPPRCCCSSCGSGSSGSWSSSGCGWGSG